MGDAHIHANPRKPGNGRGCDDVAYVVYVYAALSGHEAGHRGDEEPACWLVSGCSPKNRTVRDRRS